MQEEIWKEVRGFPGYYVSTKGRIYSTKSNIMLKQSVRNYNDSNWYYRVSLMARGKSVQKYVHRLVLETFNPIEGMEELTVNHIDEDTSNNCLENLEWMTIADNTRYSQGQWVQQETIDGQIVGQFPSIRAAARSVNGDSHTMCKRVKDHKVYKNFIWKKIDNPRKK